MPVSSRRRSNKRCGQPFGAHISNVGSNTFRGSERAVVPIPTALQNRVERAYGNDKSLYT